MTAKIDTQPAGGLSISPISKDISANEAIEAPASYRVIYVFRDDQEKHVGRLKVGDTTLRTNKPHNEIIQAEMEAAAHKRIATYTRTAEVGVVLEHVELAIRPAKEQVGLPEEKVTEWEGFRDYAVHAVLQRSGHAKKVALKNKKGGEWFEITVDEARAAIAAVKAHEHFIADSDQVLLNTITLRPEQEDAVKKTASCFKGATLEQPRRMLWNAKMRFGKTLTSYSLVRKIAEADAPYKVLIITHRPDVNDSWWDDFKKLGMDKDGWAYGSKRTRLSWDDVSHNDRLFWFASIQDLRGSHKTSEAEAIDELVKNKELFETEWDLVITDEAHEGTLTELAKRMFMGIKSRQYLDLSGTPFNIIDLDDWEDEELAQRFAYDDRYNWSYPDERKAKRAWTEAHGGDDTGNPYASLPEVRFITYDVSDAISSLNDEDVSGKKTGIDFSELFSTRPTDKGVQFVHEEQVEDLLHKMQALGRYSDDPSLFPYHSNFDNYFNHTLWMLPNVAACEAMEALLGRHSSGFSGFKVVNATGKGGDTWDGDKTALEAVRKAIRENRNTITLSCQMLTTGVTVTPWTAVFMLNNTKSPMLYMQTAFRAASPGSLPDGRAKEFAYVFDFNPDRCLQLIVETAKVNAKESKNGDPVEQAELDKASVSEYLEYISLLSLTGSKFTAPDSDLIMERLNEAYISEVIEKGFDSPKLWNSKQLQEFDIEKVKILEALRKLQGGKDSEASRKGVLPITELSPEERARLKELVEKAEADPQVELDEDERAEKKELEKKAGEAKKQERKNRQNAVSILAGVAARLPMLVYASPAEERITPENFASLIDDESWQEFMPKNLIRVMPEGTKTLEERQEEALADEGNLLYWEDVRRFFDPVIFSLACERIRRTARELDEKPPLERAFRTAALFSNFKNPDKETVLTPFRVVTMQYANTLGGLQFIDLEHSTAEHVLAYTRNLTTGELESHTMKKTIELLDMGTHELAPVWKTSDVDPVQSDVKDFWEDPETTVFDINSKTALYPLYAAASLFYEGKRAFEEANGKPLDDETQRELWQKIVKYQIFVNCRVPYSAKIAQRVLAGYNDYEVNTSVVDVLEVRSKLKEVRLPKSEGKKGTRPLTDEEEALLWRFIFDPRDLRDKTTEAVLEELHVEDTEQMEELLKQLTEEDSSKFAAVVSNPPYQIEMLQYESTGSDGSVVNVFQEFYSIGLLLADHLSMVFPGGRWIQRSKTADSIADTIFKTVSTIDWYPNGDETNVLKLFSTARISDGIAIVSAHDGVKSDTIVHNGEIIPRPKGKEILPLHKELTPIIRKALAFSSKSAASYRGTIGFFGLSSNFVEKNPSKVVPIAHDPAMLRSPIKAFLGNETPGKGKKVQEYWLERDAIIWTEDRERVLSQWKVIGTQGQIAKAPEKTTHIVVDNEHVVGWAYVILRTFATETEATHYKAYLDSTFSRQMLKASRGGKTAQWGSFVPDLEDYTSSNPHIDWTKPLDPQLYKLFGLTEEEIAVIEGRVH